MILSLEIKRKRLFEENLICMYIVSGRGCTAPWWEVERSMGTIVASGAIGGHSIKTGDGEGIQKEE